MSHNEHQANSQRARHFGGLMADCLTDLASVPEFFDNLFYLFTIVSGKPTDAERNAGRILMRKMFADWLYPDIGPEEEEKVINKPIRTPKKVIKKSNYSKQHKER